MNGEMYLLDTHVIIWAIENPSRLSKNATAALHKGERVLSVASFWEVVIKTRKGESDIGDPVRWWHRVVTDLDATVLPIRQAHIEAVVALAEHHKDPFDRVLVAQAIAEGFTLISKDADIRRYPVMTLW